MGHHRTIIAVIPALALCLAACNGGDQVAEQSASPPGAVSPGSDPTGVSSTSSPSTTDLAVVTSPSEDTDDDTTGETGETGETGGDGSGGAGGDGSGGAGTGDTVTDTGSTATGSGGANRNIDESGLALIAANLYSVPGAGAHCEGDQRYVAPAAGGDLFVACANGLGDVALPGRLTLSTPAGTVVGSVEVRLHDTEPATVAGWTARPLVLTLADGTERTSGIALSSAGGDPAFDLIVPFLLPHDRPAGTWRSEYTAASGGVTTDELPVRAPCAGAGGGGSLSDPFAFAPSIAFTREGPVPFDHCLAFPDVVGSTAEEADAIVQQYASAVGVGLNVNVVTVCGEPGVTSSDPPARVVDREIVRGQPPDQGTLSPGVTLTAGVGCPRVAELEGLRFVDADRIVAEQFPDFERSSPSCSGDSVVVRAAVVPSTVTLECAPTPAPASDPGSATDSSVPDVEAVEDLEADGDPDPGRADPEGVGAGQQGP